MRRGPWIACAVSALAAALTSAEARAANAAGAWVVNLNTTLFAYSRLAYTLELPRPLGNTEGDLVGWDWGPSANPVSLEVAYHLSDSFNLGLLLEFGYWKVTTQSEILGIDQSEEMGRFLVGPRFEYVFANSGAFRPFVLGVVGFTTAPRRDAGVQQDVARAISFTGIDCLLGVGVHWFLTDSFSLDLGARGGYGVGTGKVDQEVANMPYANVNATGSLVTATALLGVSGWVP